MIAVAHGLGIPVDPPRAEEDQTLGLEDALVARVKIKPLTSSMRVDVQQKRQMEVEVRTLECFVLVDPNWNFILTVQVILGVPLARAKELGMDTPVLETLYVILAAIDARNAGRIQALL